MFIKNIGYNQNGNIKVIASLLPNICGYASGMVGCYLVAFYFGSVGQYGS